MTDEANGVDGDRVGKTRGRCDYCRNPIPESPVALERDGREYAFCSVACRRAMDDSDSVFTTYRGHRWYHPDVSALDANLPQGVPRNAFVLLSAQPGARETELQAELVWRALQSGEPAVFVSFQEPPVSVIETFLTMEWNVLPYLESGTLGVLDCFTHRVEDRERMLERMNDWNAHVHGVAQDAVTEVTDPSDVRQLEGRLDDCTSERDMHDSGIVVIDSLTELGSLLQPVQAYDFVKDVRADVCKGRFVPVFASAAYAGDADRFPHDLEYVFDGIVDMELDPEIVEDALIKRMRVRKMNGVLAYPEWTAYEFTSEDGLVTFDPRVEIEKSREAEGAVEADVRGSEESESGDERSPDADGE